MKRLVRDLMKQRDLTGFLALNPHDTINAAAAVLSRSDDGAALVMQDQSPCGILTERDILRMVGSGEYSVRENAPVFEVMTNRVYFVTTEHTLEECLMIMSRHRVRHVIVLENSVPCALLSQHLIMEVVMEDKQHLIEDLNRYITGFGVSADSVTWRLSLQIA